MMRIGLKIIYNALNPMDFYKLDTMMYPQHGIMVSRTDHGIAVDNTIVRTMKNLYL